MSTLCLQQETLIPSARRTSPTPFPVGLVCSSSAFVGSPAHAKRGRSASIGTYETQLRNHNATLCMSPIMHTSTCVMVSSGSVAEGCSVTGSGAFPATLPTPPVANCPLETFPSPKVRRPPSFFGIQTTPRSGFVPFPVQAMQPFVPANVGAIPVLANGSPEPTNFNCRSCLASGFVEASQPQTASSVGFASCCHSTAPITPSVGQASSMLLHSTSTLQSLGSIDGLRSRSCQRAASVTARTSSTTPVLGVAPPLRRGGSLSVPSAGRHQIRDCMSGSRISSSSAGVTSVPAPMLTSQGGGGAFVLAPTLIGPSPTVGHSQPRFWSSPMPLSNPASPLSGHRSASVESLRTAPSCCMQRNQTKVAVVLPPTHILGEGFHTGTEDAPRANSQAQCLDIQRQTCCGPSSAELVERSKEVISKRSNISHGESPTNETLPVEKTNNSLATASSMIKFSIASTTAATPASPLSRLRALQRAPSKESPNKSPTDQPYSKEKVNNSPATVSAIVDATIPPAATDVVVVTLASPPPRFRALQRAPNQEGRINVRELNCSKSPSPSKIARKGCLGGRRKESNSLEQLSPPTRPRAKSAASVGTLFERRSASMTLAGDRQRSPRAKRCLSPQARVATLAEPASSPQSPVSNVTRECSKSSAETEYREHACRSSQTNPKSKDSCQDGYYDDEDAGSTRTTSPWASPKGSPLVRARRKDVDAKLEERGIETFVDDIEIKDPAREHFSMVFRRISDALECRTILDSQLFEDAVANAVPGDKAMHPNRAAGGLILLEHVPDAFWRHDRHARDHGGSLVQSLFMDSMPHSNIEIVSIDQVLRPELLARFLKCVIEERSSVEATFHGTRAEFIPRLLLEGLNPDMCTTGAYGRGAYVGVHAGIAHQYADPDTDGFRYMCVVLVVTGKDVVKGQSGVEMSSTSMDRLVNPTQYCLVDERRLYISHLITYRTTETGRHRIGGGWEDPFQLKLSSATRRAASARKQSGLR